MKKDSLDKRTKWCYCIGATGRDAAYALVSMYLLTYVQYTMKLTVAQFGVISAAIVICLIWDAINDALMGIIIENTHFKSGKFKPWILKILTNECYAVIRGRNKSVPTDDIEEVPDKETETEEKVTLWETVSRLKLEQRTVILLFYYQDLSIKEISKVLGISEDTVKKRLSRAREALRQSLEEV